MTPVKNTIFVTEDLEVITEPVRTWLSFPGRATSPVAIRWVFVLLLDGYL